MNAFRGLGLGTGTYTGRMAEMTSPGSSLRQTLAESKAFRAASLKSEIGRAYAVMGVVGLVTLAVVSRVFTSAATDSRLLYFAGVSAAVLVAVQLGILLFARARARAGLGMPLWFSALTVVIECLIPTGSMLVQMKTATVPPHAALSSPPILVYGLLIGLTTLRLRPVLCVLAGATAAAGYVALFLHVHYGLGLKQSTTGLPREAYFSTPILILVSGFAAAWVTIEIRKHLHAALNEAETRRKMDRIEQDLSVAQSIQRALLPRKSPAIPGFDIAGWNRPADQTGGDYYDWQALPDGGWIISLADVSGHGIGPALVTAACRAYVRASSHYDGELPSLTARINRLLADDLSDGRFVTLVSVRIRPGDGGLELLSAGHGPVLLLRRAASRVEDINPNDVPLAVVPDMTFGPQQRLVMEEGDVLALITDGFFEWAKNSADGQREQFGVERVREAIKRHAHLPAGSLVEALAADAAAFAGGVPQQDDLTVVIIKRMDAGVSG